MALKQFTKYGDLLNSFEYREAMVGLLNPGRLGGYTNITNTTGLTFEVRHQSNSSRKLAADNVTAIQFGAFMTKTGQIYHEDANVIVTLNSNLTAAVRYDALYASVLYSTNSAGDTPTYAIAENQSALTYEASQGASSIGGNTSVYLGMFTIQPGATTAAGVSYLPSYFSVFAGISSHGDIYRNYLYPVHVKKSIVNIYNQTVEINDSIPLTDLTGGLFSFQVQPEWNNKIIYVRNNTSGATKYRAVIPNDIATEYGDENGFRIRFLWNDSPIEVVVQQIVAGGFILSKPADKLPETRLQHSIIEFQVVSLPVDGFFSIMSGDLKSV